MFFGATSFSASPFADAGEINALVTLTGNQINVSIGNAQVVFPVTVPITGVEFSLATDTVDVITWNLIPPGASQIWIPIDPDNP
jgi:hypothetical protein